MVRQAHHERNQHLAVRPELVEGLIQHLLNKRRNYILFLRIRLRYTIAQPLLAGIFADEISHL